LLAGPGSTSSILEISGRCGFASLGPFNRAFKATMGCTPTAYRAACLARGTSMDPPAAAPDPVAWQMASPQAAAR
jgi:hypothetical protein